MRKGLGKNLGKGYFNLIPIDSHVHSLSAKGVKTRQKVLYARRNIKDPVVHILSPAEFNQKFSKDYNEYEVGYATTKIHPNGDVHVYLKDSGDNERNGLLLMHELKELEIFDDLVNKKGVDPRIADEMAHNMNPVKIKGVSATYELDATN
jgi:hypothetical protein